MGFQLSVLYEAQCVDLVIDVGAHDSSRRLIEMDCIFVRVDSG